MVDKGITIAKLVDEDFWRISFWDSSRRYKYPFQTKLRLSDEAVDRLWRRLSDLYLATGGENGKYDFVALLYGAGVMFRTNYDYVPSPKPNIWWNVLPDWLKGEASVSY